METSDTAAIQQDKEPAIMVREPDATMQPTPQDIQLMSKRRVLSFEPQLRLEWRGQDGQNETEQSDHSASLGDSITSSTRIRFSVQTGVRDQAQRLEGCVASFARGAFGRAGPAQLRRAAFVLAEVPIAAVKPHLRDREPPPPLVDELITATYHAIVQGGTRRNAGDGASAPL